MELDVRTRRLGSIANTLTLVYVLEKQIEDAEKELNQLNDVVFDVKSTTFLKASKKINLTRSGISIIRDSKKTLQHPYEDLLDLKLLSVNVISISFKGIDKDMLFESKDASKLAQALRIRRHKHLTLQKKKMLLNLSYRFYSRLNDSTGPLGLNNNWKPSLPQSMILSKKDSKLLSLLIESEGNDQGMVSFREVKSLNEEDLSKLESVLNPLVLSFKKYEEAKAVKNFVDSFDGLGRNSEKVAQKTREFLDTLKERILCVHRDQIISELEIEIPIDILASSIEKILQKTILPLVYKSMMNIFMKNMGHIDNIIESKKAVIRELSQEDVGIPAKLISKSKWSFAILELNNLKNYILPFEKLECILSCMRSVVDTTKIEKSFSESSGISADDLLPILIFIVSSSNAVALESLSQYLWLVSDPAELSGESGYYLTMFTSVVEFIKNYEKPVIEKSDPVDIPVKPSTLQENGNNTCPENTLNVQSETKSPLGTMRKRSGSYTSGDSMTNRRDHRSMMIRKSEDYDFFCVPLIFKEVDKKS